VVCRTPYLNGVSACHWHSPLRSGPAHVEAICHRMCDEPYIERI